MKHSSLIMDGSAYCRPWSNPSWRRLACCLIILFISGCQPKSPTITLALLGDLMLGRVVNPQPNSLAYLKPDLANADLVLANLESPLAQILPVTISTYNLCALSERAEVLSDWGIDMVSVANNHNHDCGPNVAGETRAILENVGITSIGSRLEPVFRNINGLRLAFLAFDDISSELDSDAAAQAIQTARSTGAVVVVSMHWGAEYQSGVTDRQKSLADQFARAGASLIWGHHPHVLQPAAWIETTQGKTLVLFSLGNALFDQGGLDDTRQSALVEIAMDESGIETVRSVPFEIDVRESRIVQPDIETVKVINGRLNLSMLNKNNIQSP
ncbi:MAG: CapA family protein [Anaerolineales bacterium]